MPACSQQRVGEVAGDHRQQSDEQRAHNAESEYEEAADQRAGNCYPHTDQARHGADFQQRKALPVHRPSHGAHDEVGQPIAPDHRQNQQSGPAVSAEEIRERRDHSAVKPADGSANSATHVNRFFRLLHFIARIAFGRAPCQQRGSHADEDHASEKDQTRAPGHQLRDVGRERGSSERCQPIAKLIGAEHGALFFRRRDLDAPRIDGNVLAGT